MMGYKVPEQRLYVSFSLDQTVPANHLVRRLSAAVDFGFVYGFLKRVYSHTGKPSVDPVVLFKLSLLAYLFNISSERRLCEEASLNLAWRWFLGYELDEPIPDHSVMTKARRPFGRSVYERFFRQIVMLCEAKGLVEGDVLFIDSTLIKANASQSSFRSGKLLEQRLPKAEQFVSDLWLVNDEEEEPPPREKKRSGRPRKPPGEGSNSRSVANDLGCSLTNPDAQLFRKPGMLTLLSHKVQMVVDGGTAGIITAVEARPSCEADSHAVIQMLTKHQLAVGRGRSWGIMAMSWWDSGMVDSNNPTP